MACRPESAACGSRVKAGLRVEVDDDVGGDAVGDGVGVVDVRFEQRAGDVEALGRDGLVLAFDHLHGRVDERQLEERGDGGGGADGEEWCRRSRRRLELRDGLGWGDAAQPGAELRGDFFGLQLASEEAATAAAAAGAGRADDAVGEDDDVIFGVEVAGVELLRVDDGEGELELIEEPADPAGGHGAAVDVDEGDAGGMKLDGRAGGRLRDGGGVDAEGLGRGFEKLLRCGGVGQPERAGRELFAVGGGRVLQPVDGLVGFEEAVGEGVGVVVLVADEVAGGCCR